MLKEAILLIEGIEPVDEKTENKKEELYLEVISKLKSIKRDLQNWKRKAANTQQKATSLSAPISALQSLVRPWEGDHLRHAKKDYMADDFSEIEDSMAREIKSINDDIEELKGDYEKIDTDRQLREWERVQKSNEEWLKNPENRKKLEDMKNKLI